MLARLAATALAALSLSAHAAPTTIDFEDVPFSWVPVALLDPGYQGFDFGGGAGPASWIASPSWFPLWPGDQSHSGDNYVWGNGGFEMQMTRSGGGYFDVLSMWTRAAEDPTMSVVAHGYRNGAEVYSQTFAEGMTYGKNTLDFYGIDMLTFDMNGTLLLDDFAVNQATVVAEPVMPALMLAGLALVGLVARRRRA